MFFNAIYLLHKNFPLQLFIDFFSFCVDTVEMHPWRYMVALPSVCANEHCTVMCMDYLHGTLRLYKSASQTFWRSPFYATVLCFCKVPYSPLEAVRLEENAYIVPHLIVHATLFSLQILTE